MTDKIATALTRGIWAVAAALVLLAGAIAYSSSQTQQLAAGEDPERLAAADLGTDRADSERALLAEIESALDTFSVDDLEVALSGSRAVIAGTAPDEEHRAQIEETVLGLDGVASVDSDNLKVLAIQYRCTDLIRSQPRWVCIDSVEFDGTTLRANFTSEDGGRSFEIGSGFNIHFFDGDLHEPATAGISGDASTGGGDWQVWDVTPTYETSKFADTDIEMLCARIATPFHTLESLDSGNCWPVTNT